MEYCHYTFQG
jgi:hypothetical protein